MLKKKNYYFFFDERNLTTHSGWILKACFRYLPPDLTKWLKPQGLKSKRCLRNDHLSTESSRSKHDLDIATRWWFKVYFVRCQSNSKPIAEDGSLLSSIAMFCWSNVCADFWIVIELVYVSWFMWAGVTSKIKIAEISLIIAYVIIFMRLASKFLKYK